MNDFEYLALIVAIPLGLTLVEIAQGISTALRRRDVRIGIYTPLLAGLLIVNTSVVIYDLWDSQSRIVMSFLLVVCALIGSIGYYVSASFLVPDDPREGLDLDDWFFRFRKISLGLTVLISTVAGMTVFDDSGAVGDLEGLIVVSVVFFTPVALAIFARRRWIILTGMVLLYVVFGLGALAQLAAAP